MTLLLAALLACGSEPAPTSVPAQPDKPSQPLTPPAEPADAVIDATAADLGALANPSALNEKAPDAFKARFTTTKGDIVIEVHREWSPNGADRFYNLVKNGYFEDIAFFRNIKGFMVQFGIHGDPQLNAIWKDAKITDDTVVKSNTPGYVSFATSGPNTRTTQMFINHGGNDSLDGMGFSPFGQVVEGMSVVNELYDGYGEGAPRGKGPRQDLIQKQGNSYLRAEFPQLDYIQSASIEE
ncbi:MAG: peptidylprolyl isomerase [Proteobacteria bacterium]|nr:peptidylprolyl isomerase [Pseudomonadota bacterium]MCP4918302.1 peptidylprolyl isomerase [Pseudomonadota bacterium]